jgi:hypothetical protein
MVQCPQPTVETVTQIAACPGPWVSYEALAAKLLEHAKQRALGGIFRLEFQVQRMVRMNQSHCQSVCGTAKPLAVAKRLGRVQVRRVRRQALLAAVQTTAPEMKVELTGDGAGRCSAKFLGSLLPANLGDQGHVTAPLDDRSSSKQR